MSELTERLPRLVAVYQQYLDDEQTAKFVQQVSRHYTVGTLERLAEYGPRVVRRAATMALGFLADYASNYVLGRRLNDADRGVRMLAENAIRDLWCRDGSELQRHSLRVLLRLNQSRQPTAVVRLASKLIDEAPFFAEAWNQRAIAYFQLQRFDDSANDCHQTLELNPYHFGAAVGMGHCYLELNEPVAALECFRRAMRLNPDLEDVRTQVLYLQKVLDA